MARDHWIFPGFCLHSSFTPFNEQEKGCMIFSRGWAAGGGVQHFTPILFLIFFHNHCDSSNQHLLCRFIKTIIPGDLLMRDLPHPQKLRKLRTDKHRAMVWQTTFGGPSTAKQWSRQLTISAFLSCLDSNAKTYRVYRHVDVRIWPPSPEPETTSMPTTDHGLQSTRMVCGGVDHIRLPFNPWLTLHAMQRFLTFAAKPLCDTFPCILQQSCAHRGGHPGHVRRPAHSQSIPKAHKPDSEDLRTNPACVSLHTPLPLVLPYYPNFALEAFATPRNVLMLWEIKESTIYVVYCIPWPSMISSNIPNQTRIH
jgi:hypothetical protein